MHTLYRFFDADGQLLYIGKTTNVRARFRAHADKEWWGDVADSSLEHYATADAVAAAEVAAIRAEAPRHNVAHNESVTSRELARQRKEIAERIAESAPPFTSDEALRIARILSEPRDSARTS